ncbi:MAG: DinB family protein [Spirochaetaceae bacterium]|jgi:uncharacterized damage-inducible protein DinB|nr:DinB family protein [Spirochaetaceae bacterium]
MKETCLLFAQYHQEANQKVLSVLRTLTPEEREKARGSYYGSLSALARHIVEGTRFLQGLLKGTIGHKTPQVFAAQEVLAIPQDTAEDAQWNALATAFETLDAGLIQLVSALEEPDFSLPVPIQWYGGNPATVPVYFLLHQLIMHGVHHRGQISQILDELKIDNDYSGINVALLPLP